MEVPLALLTHDDVGVRRFGSLDHMYCRQTTQVRRSLLARFALEFQANAPCLLRIIGKPLPGNTEEAAAAAPKLGPSGPWRSDRANSCRLEET